MFTPVSYLVMAKVKENLWTEPEHDPELFYKQENDMHISKMTSSKFLKKEDVDPAILVTISKVDQADVSMENEPTEMKWTMHFKESDKPLVLNTTNIQLCALACGNEDTDDWIGKQIVLFNDPTVAFAGKITGGIRIRKPKTKNAEPEKQPEPEFDDDVGF